MRRNDEKQKKLPINGNANAVGGKLTVTLTLSDSVQSIIHFIFLLSQRHLKLKNKKKTKHMTLDLFRFFLIRADQKKDNLLFSTYMLELPVFC